MHDVLVREPDERASDAHIAAWEAAYPAYQAGDRNALNEVEGYREPDLPDLLAIHDRMAANMSLTGRLQSLRDAFDGVDELALALRDT